MPIKPNKKILPLDRIYNAIAKESPNTTQRINRLYSEGGYKEMVDNLLSDPTTKNAKKARAVIDDFHSGIYPLEMENFFENHPNASMEDFRKFSKSYLPIDKDIAAKMEYDYELSSRENAIAKKLWDAYDFDYERSYGPARAYEKARQRVIKTVPEEDVPVSAESYEELYGAEIDAPEEEQPWFKMK